MLSFQLETPQEFLPDAIPLMQAHALELKDSLSGELNLDMGHYIKSFTTGKLLLLTARDKGAMVGYQIIQIAFHNRSNTTLIAEEEALFLLPKYRKGWNGVRLLKLGIEAAKTLGAEIFYVSSQECYPIKSLLLKVGFKKKSESYMLQLRKEPENIAEVELRLENE